MRAELQYQLKLVPKNQMSFLILEHYYREGGWELVQMRLKPRSIWPWKWGKQKWEVTLKRVVRFSPEYADPEDV